MRRQVDLSEHSNRARRRFASVSDVRREMVALYWQLKEGKIVLPPGIAPTLARLLEGIGRSMMESEAELRAVAIETRMLELARTMAERGCDVPDWAFEGLERKMPN